MSVRLRSVVDLQNAINRVIEETNQTSKPVTWTAESPWSTRAELDLHLE
jgi:hypothetical protein